MLPTPPAEAMVESIEAIKTAAVHADARAELANLLEKAAVLWTVRWVRWVRRRDANRG